ncbi:MAG: hypothetical protein OEW77_05305 [Gemmatimonadota bacterium]|nr:hypothetical protein [Gemmatimonadota bacterium]
MTAGTPMSGRDTAAAFKGVIVGAIVIGALVVTMVTIVNRMYAGHEEGAAEAPAAQTP